MCSLTFFVLTIIISCQKNDEKKAVSIIWKNKKAVAVSIPNQLAEGTKPISVRVDASYDNELTIFGDIEKQEDRLIFTPLIPFTRGLTYEIFEGEKSIAQFSIPQPDASDAPKLTAIFPTQDTVPENLLKVYLQFSQPMREGRSAQHVALLDDQADTVKNAFLDLQPELWNEDRTQLTLWLDPGRIKRDLQPNKKLGAPMLKNRKYSIIISQHWKDVDGSALAKSYTKTFVTTIRDSLSPVPESWKINPPKSGTLSALMIDFQEPLDHGLLDEAFEITHEDGSKIAGEWQFVREETRELFIPKDHWKPGTYHLKVDARLEDLAANNVNRPFDRDITKGEEQKGPQAFVLVNFQVK
ncbi:hypothetical protein [Dyadobacter luticola]|uniref:SbsA Ig-like domain-containing protein n=1 Tax=Dyadobacter luticola TaxID=1979387 RepID=A0A5R9L6P2_9BACT|nr:hypothetical protein [Dyadobacter luticola]TLV04007.1 hypothetical protein FEN17_00505 [Dyadobacter luticola]